MNTPRFIIAMQKKGDKLSQGERDRLLRDITAVSCFFFFACCSLFFSLFFNNRDYFVYSYCFIREIIYSFD